MPKTAAHELFDPGLKMIEQPAEMNKLSKRGGRRLGSGFKRLFGFSPAEPVLVFPPKIPYFRQKGLQIPKSYGIINIYQCTRNAVAERNHFRGFCHRVKSAKKRSEKNA